MVGAFYVGRMVNILNQGSFSGDSSHLWWWYVFPVPAVLIAGWLLARIAALISKFIVPKLSHRLRLKAFDGISQQSYRFFTDNFAGSLVSRGRTLEMSVRDVWDGIWWTFWPLLISFISSMYILGRRSAGMLAICIVWFALFISVTLVLSRRKLHLDKQRAAKQTQLIGQFSDAMTNMANVQVFNGYQHEHDRLARISQEFNEIWKKAWNMVEISILIQNGMNGLFALGIFYELFYFWTRGLITIGEIVFIQGALMSLFGMTQQVRMGLQRLYDASAEAKEVLDILELAPEVRDRKSAKPLKIKQGIVEFDQAVFKYHDAMVVDGLSFSIHPKEKIALVGPSGAGKSTVTKLLLRFFDLTSGKISIDGQDISKVTQESLRETIAFVPQESILFHRSLLENIRYGRLDATEEEVVEAAKKAHCHEFISKLSKGYDTMVGERGIKLSGGERQRVAIARAILKNAPILILDEATSSLDSESEMLIQDALKILMRNKTVIVIAHRLSTIMEMDRIVVMQDGQVTDVGTHKELLKKVGIYQKLWHIQAGGFQG